MLTLPVPGLTLEQQPQEILLACCLWGEARGEGPVGMLGVAHVIVNRAKKGPSIKEVILKPLQFSCFNPSDPNRAKLLVPQNHEPAAWGLAIAVTHLVLGGFTEDPTHEAVNYLTRSLYESDKAPAWAKGMKVTAELGNHVFGVA